MRLVRYRMPAAFGGEPGRDERLGVVLPGDRVAAAATILPDAADTMAALITAGADEVARLRSAVSERVAALPDGATLPLTEVELLSPVARPGKIVAIGVNYGSHADEQHREAPPSPVVFAKFPTALCGPGDEVRWDRSLTDAVDFEAELAVVIGRTARRIGVGAALDHVLGYTCLNDVSARDLQYADRQFTRAKSLDTFCPMGPELVTRDDVPDPQALRIRCLVNGEVMQDASTTDMVHGVAALVSFCSQAFTLEPGDVIATGTPGGVGWFREPKRMLVDGDEVTVEIERVGRLVNRCRVERGGERPASGDDELGERRL